MTAYRRGPHGSITDVCHHLELMDVPLRMVEVCTISSEQRYGTITGTVKYYDKVLATFKYCEGLDYPLFRFHGEWLTAYGQPKVYTPENGKSKVEFRLTLGPHDNPALHIWGNLATPELHDFAMSFIRANHMDDPRYILRTKGYCFFQGGSNDRNGQWIYIELDGKHGEEIVKYFSDNFQYVNGEQLEVEE